MVDRPRRAVTHGGPAGGMDRAAALRDRRAPRQARAAAARRRQRAPRAAPHAAAARPRAALDAGRFPQGANVLREERLVRACERRLRHGLSAVRRAGQAFEPDSRGLRTRSGRHYFPATFATYAATALICAGVSRPLNAGIAAPPFSTWRATRSFAGFS